MNGVLVDAGPLIASLDGSDPDHERCVETLASLRRPVATVWPVLAEASHLLARQSPGSRDAVLSLVALDRLRLADLSKDDVPRMRELMKKYADLPMDLADAALIAVAEREDIDTVFTLDRRDFSLYRPRHIGRFKLLP